MRAGLGLGGRHLDREAALEGLAHAARGAVRLRRAQARVAHRVPLRAGVPQALPRVITRLRFVLFEASLLL